MYLKYAVILLTFSTLTYASTTEEGQMVTPPKNVQIMQPQTEEKAHGFAGMTEAYAFTSSISNKCGPSTTANHCFVQLSTSAVGASTTQGTNSCPTDYSPILAFGNKVYVAGTNQVVVFTQGDVRLRVSQAEYNFYTGQGYTCVADTAGGRAGMVSQTIYTRNSTSGYSINTFNSVNGTFMYITEITGAGKICYTLPHVYAPDTTCDWGIVAGAYYEYTFYVVGYTVKCTRGAGFWLPGSSTPTFPLAAPGTDFTPTTVICAKSYTVWKPKS